MQGVSNAYDIVRDRDRYDAGAAEAGTIFPSLDTYEANGDQIVGYYNYEHREPAADVESDARRSARAVHFPAARSHRAEHNPAVSGRAARLVPQSAPAIDPATLAAWMADPQLIVPEGFNVVAVSIDYRWFTNGYVHIPRAIPAVAARRAAGGCDSISMARLRERGFNGRGHADLSLERHRTMRSLSALRNRNAYEYYGRLAIARDATGISASCSRDSIGAAILTLEENHIPPDLEPQTITIQKAAAE